MKIADAIAQKLWPGSPLRHDACCRRKARGGLGRIEEGEERLCFLELPRLGFGVPALAGPATQLTKHLQNRLKAGLQTTLPQGLSVQGPQDRILCCQSHGFDRARHGALPSGRHLRFLVRKLNPEAETLAPQ